MEEPIKHIDVLIVGAGPSGLMLAAQLLRHGIQPVIIDRKKGPDKTSKAVMLHARSLEIFRQLGMADELTAEGVACHEVIIRTKITTTVDFTSMENPGTPFPYVLGIAQSKVERQLIARLTENACPVMWETELVSLRQDDHTAQVGVVHQGIPQYWSCRWVVAADGAGGSVRNALGIPVETDGPRKVFIMADLQISDVPHRRIHLALVKKGFLGFFPLDAHGLYRLVFLQPKDWKTPLAEHVPYRVLKNHIDELLGFALPVRECAWAGVFATQRRSATLFGRQRCFLIGDAAHTYTPIAAMGINAGLQDAANLGWKLAGVLSGKISAQVLKSYPQERSMTISAITPIDRLLDTLTAPPSMQQLVHRWLFVNGLACLSKRKDRLRKLFERIFQLSPGYRRGHLAAHHATNRGIRAGDRLPFLALYDEKSQLATDLHRWMEKPGFVFLILGTIGHHQLHIIGRWMKQKYPRGMHLYYLPYSMRNQHLFDAFELKPTGTKMVLVRPDMYIAYMNDILNVNLIDTYMEEIVGWKSSGYSAQQT